MSQWSSAKAKRVLAALLRIGWNVKRESSSHKILFRPGWPDVVFAFMTETKLAQRRWRELPNILVSSPKTCDCDEWKNDGSCFRTALSIKARLGMDCFQ